MTRLILFAALAAALTAAPARAGRYAGKPFPDFEATDALTGERFSLGELRGSAVVIDFWATWCGPCRRELPLLKQVHDRFAAQGLQVVSISLDTSETRFKAFVSRNDMPWRHVMEGGGWNSRLARQYGIHSIPSVFVLDRDGVCVSDHARGPALERAVEQALAAGGSAGRDDLPAETVELLAAELRAAAQELRSVMGPVEAVAARLESITDVLDRTTDDLSSPSAARRLVGTRRALDQARHRLFMLGVLDEGTAVAIGEPPSDRAMEKRQVVQMLSAAGAMIAVCEQTLEPMRRARRDVSELWRELGGGSMGDQELRDRISLVRADVAGLVECEPWLDQVDATRRVINEAQEPLDELLARLDELDRRISSFDADPGAQMAALAQDVSAALAEAGLGVLRPSPDPAQQRQLLARSVSEARRVTLAERRRVHGLAREVALLLGELDQRLAAGDDLDPLRRRFSDLAREALAARDSV